jgi:4-amino-4-deoxy-L-arabinose transferase-like glycosyltransferase
MIPLSSTHAAEVSSVRAGLMPDWEKWAVRLLLVVYLVVQVNNIYNLAYRGQDFDFHVGFTKELMERTNGAWFKMDSTSRPLLYWLGGWCERYTHGRYAYELASMIAMLAGLPAFWVIHRAMRRFIAQSELRVALLVIMTLLPVNVIVGVVYSGDLFALLPYALVAWMLTLSLEAKSEQSALGYAAAAGLVLAAANFAKFTFLLMPYAVIAVILLVWRWRRIEARRVLIALLFVALLPFGVGTAIQRKSDRELAGEEERHEFMPKGTGEMTWTSLLGLKRSDARIFEAPGYFDQEMIDGNMMPPLIQPNSYSYPALLHLAAFTDVLDYANQGGNDPGVLRPEPQKTYSKRSVRSGVIWSVLAVLAVVVIAGRLIWSLYRPVVAPPTSIAVWAVLGAVWFLPLVLVLPYVHNAYYWGYWLPRLVVPALWSAALIAGWAADGLLAGRSRWWSRAVLVLALVQASWQVLSVWY